jgi:hypothetical protein
LTDDSVTSTLREKLNMRWFSSRVTDLLHCVAPHFELQRSPLPDKQAKPF